MKNDNIGCFGWVVFWAAIAFAIWKTVAIFSADIPEWLKWYLIG